MEDCSCVYFDDDGYGPSCFSHRVRKARKEHRCCECRRIIVKGERYHYESGIWDGSADDFKTCFDCYEVRSEMFCDGFEYGNMWGMLREHLSETDGHISSSCIAGLPPRARAMICDAIEEYWEDG